MNEEKKEMEPEKVENDTKENNPNINAEKDAKSENADVKGDTNINETVSEENLTKPGNRKYLSHYVYQGEWRPTRPLRSVAAKDTSPGPAIVNLPSITGDHDHDPRLTKAPAFTMREKDFLPYFALGPGPALYNTRKLTNKGKDECHAAKLADKIDGLKLFMSPGPAAYHKGDCDSAVYPQTPAYTIRKKTKTKKAMFAPAPNTYTLPKVIGPGKSPFCGAPAYSIGDRLDWKGAPMQCPGPSTYQLPSTNVVKEKPPAFTMGLRTLSQMTGPVTPGPASNELHLVKFHKSSTPRFTFGIRHSPYKRLQTFAPGD